MSFLPQRTTLGNLEILEVYEFYDKPCLFSCQNLAGQIYMVVWFDENSGSDSWLYAPTSPKRFSQIVSGRVDLRDVFLQAEDGFVFEVTIDHDRDNTEVITVFCNLLQDDKLPEPGEYIDTQSETPISLRGKKDTIRSAIQLRTTVLNLAFGFQGFDGMQAPASDLGAILQSTQNLIDALGQYKAGQPTVKGNIPERITKQTKLAVTGTYIGSFGVELIALVQPDLWGNSLAEEAVEAFLKLVKIGKNAESLRDFLLESQPRAASRYRILLEKLVNAKARIKAEWASSSQDKNDVAELLLSDAKTVLAIVNQVEAEKPKQYNIEGELVGVNKRTKSFEIWETEGVTKKYSGRILESALNTAETATVSNIYIATIIETIEITLAGEEKTKYQLADLKLPEPSSTPPSK